MRTKDLIKQFGLRDTEEWRGSCKRLRWRKARNGPGRDKGTNKLDSALESVYSLVKKK
jgi:hypothetical protein